MFSIIRANLDNNSNISVPQQVKICTLNRWRWRSAFAVICCVRAFNDLLRSRASKNKVSPGGSSDRVVVDLVQGYSCLDDIDQPTLTKLVREKNLEKLDEFRGVQGIAFSLKSNVHDGVDGDDDDDILHRIEAFGNNTYHYPPRKSFCHFVWEAFQDPTIAILLASATLSLGFGIKKKEGWYDGGSIFLAVFLVISLSAISNFRQSRLFDKLSKVSNNIQTEVVRNGRRKQISIYEIVVGDVVCLKIGDQVPADGLFVDGHSLRVDESIITGESDHVEINHSQNPFLISGSQVAEGCGRMLVTSVGMNTAWGEMMSSNSVDSADKTPLQDQLSKLSSAMRIFGSVLLLLAAVVCYLTGNKKNKTGHNERGGINVLVEFIATAANTAVLAIPGGLPVAFTLTLSYSLSRIMAAKAMVPKLYACETLNSVTTICMDISGTLTLSEMTVMKFWLGKESIGKGSYTSVVPSVLDLLHQALSLNNSTSVLWEKGTLSVFPIERAILSWVVLEQNLEMEQIRQNCSILQVEEFNSETRRSGVLIKKNADNTIHVHWKGAAEIILEMCSHYYDRDGDARVLEDSGRREFNQIIQVMASGSLRCIAFAHKQIFEANHDDGEIKQQLPEKSLILLGIVGLSDSCKKAVKDCQDAGVNIKMITGDNVFKAKAIATECGILGHNHTLNDGSVVDGAQFRNYTDDERMEKVDKIVVMASSSPFDELLMVKYLKRKGHVVAVTGDGTSDAPSLKETGVGLFVGIQGTEISEKSTDILIQDGNFASVVKVLRWGRCTYNNIQKFTQFQLTANISVPVITFVTAVSRGREPLTALAALWMNLIINPLGALVLATESPTKEQMEKPRPMDRTEPLITNIMWRNLLGQALYQIAVILTLQFKGESIFGVNQQVNDSMVYNTFVLCQVFNQFNARRLERKNVFEGIHRNKLFLVMVGITITLQVMVVEFLKRFASTERLDWGQWAACFGISAASWAIGLLIKFIPVPEKSFAIWLFKTR